jgi:predicted metal-dependent phosphoesterase TrpH
MAEKQLWRVDLHAHTIFSKDSLTHVQAFLGRARAVGLHRIAVTEHNRLDGALRAKELDPELVIVGEEVKTATGGEIIGYFLKQPVPKGLSPQETIARMRAQDAFITIPHPLDSLRRSAMGMDETLKIIDLVDALEVRNARCVRPADNDAALALAREHGKLVTAGSDAHIPQEIGRCYMEMPPFDENAASFAAALALGVPVGEVSPFWPHLMSTWAKIRKRIAPVDLLRE